MNRYLAPVCFVILACTGSKTTGQIRATNVSLIDTSQAELYTWAPNNVRVSGLLAEDEVLLDGAGAETHSGDVYVFQPKVGPETSTLTVRRNGVNIVVKLFAIRRMPDPVITISHVKTSSKANKFRVSDLRAASGLDISSGNLHMVFEIVGFEFGVLLQGRYQQLAPSTSNAFTAEQRSILGRIQAGDRLYIDHIKVKGPDGNLRIFNSIALRIVNYSLCEPGAQTSRLCRTRQNSR